MVSNAGGLIGVWTHLSDRPLDYARNVKAMVDVIGVNHVCQATDIKLTQRAATWRSTFRWGTGHSGCCKRAAADLPLTSSLSFSLRVKSSTSQGLILRKVDFDSIFRPDRHVIATERRLTCFGMSLLRLPPFPPKVEKRKAKSLPPFLFRFDS
jgi:hypothetical protein